jgi:hypothetical protein
VNERLSKLLVVAIQIVLILVALFVLYMLVAP